MVVISQMTILCQKKIDIQRVQLHSPNTGKISNSISMGSLGVLASMNQARLPVATLNHCISFEL